MAHAGCLVNGGYFDISVGTCSSYLVRCHYPKRRGFNSNQFILCHTSCGSQIWTGFSWFFVLGSITWGRSWNLTGCNIPHSSPHVSGTLARVVVKLRSSETLDRSPTHGLSAWSLQGDWIFYMRLTSPRASVPRKTGRSCLAFPNLSMGLTYLHFLLSEVVISLS